MSSLFRCGRCLSAGRSAPAVARLDDGGNLYARVGRVASGSFPGWALDRSARIASEIARGGRVEWVTPPGRDIETDVREAMLGAYKQDRPGSRPVWLPMLDGSRQVLKCPVRGCGHRMQVTPKGLRRLVRDHPGRVEHFL